MSVIRNFGLCVAVVGLALGVGLAAQASELHWTYEGEEGPAHWGSLSEDFAACGAGSMPGESLERYQAACRMMVSR